MNSLYFSLKGIIIISTCIIILISSFILAVRFLDKGITFTRQRAIVKN